MLKLSTAAWWWKHFLVLIGLSFFFFIYFIELNHMVVLQVVEEVGCVTLTCCSSLLEQFSFGIFLIDIIEACFLNELLFHLDQIYFFYLSYHSSCFNTGAVLHFSVSLLSCYGLDRVESCDYTCCTHSTLS